MYVRNKNIQTGCGQPPRLSPERGRDIEGGYIIVYNPKLGALLCRNPKGLTKKYQVSI